MGTVILQTLQVCFHIPQYNSNISRCERAGIILRLATSIIDAHVWAGEVVCCRTCPVAMNPSTLAGLDASTPRARAVEAVVTSIAYPYIFSCCCVYPLSAANAAVVTPRR